MIDAAISVARLLFCALILSELLGVAALRGQYAVNPEDGEKRAAAGLVSLFLAFLFVATFAAVLKGAAR